MSSSSFLCPIHSIKPVLEKEENCFQIITSLTQVSLYIKNSSKLCYCSIKCLIRKISICWVHNSNTPFIYYLTTLLWLERNRMHLSPRCSYSSLSFPWSQLQWMRQAMNLSQSSRRSSIGLCLPSPRTPAKRRSVGWSYDPCTVATGRLRDRSTAHLSLRSSSKWPSSSSWTGGPRWWRPATEKEEGEETVTGWWSC